MPFRLRFSTSRRPCDVPHATSGRDCVAPQVVGNSTARGCTSLPLLSEMLDEAAANSAGMCAAILARVQRSLDGLRIVPPKARSFFASSDREHGHAAEELVQQLHLLYDRAPKSSLRTSIDDARRQAVSEAREQAAAGRALVVHEAEPLSLAQRALRLLATCAVLGGDGSCGDALAAAARRTLCDLLDASAAHEELIVAEALGVLLPPVLSLTSPPHVHSDCLLALEALATASARLREHLAPHAAALCTCATDAIGAVPLPLLRLLAALAHHPDACVRTKPHRPDALHAASPATALHAAGLTRTLIGWLSHPQPIHPQPIHPPIHPQAGGIRSNERSHEPARLPWTCAEGEVCAWRVAEGVARHVRPAAQQMWDAGLAHVARHELMRLVATSVASAAVRADATSAQAPADSAPSPQGALADGAQGASPQGDGVQGVIAQGEIAQGDGARGDGARGDGARGDSVQGGSGQGGGARSAEEAAHLAAQLLCTLEALGTHVPAAHALLVGQQTSAAAAREVTQTEREVTQQTDLQTAAHEPHPAADGSGAAEAPPVADAWADAFLTRLSAGG